MRQTKPFFGSPAAEYQTSHRRRLAHAHGGHGRGNVHHGVVDGETRGDAPAGGVDVEVYRRGRLVAFEEQELGDDAGGEGVVDRAVEADDSLGEEAGEDVIFERRERALVCLLACGSRCRKCFRTGAPTASLSGQRFFRFMGYQCYDGIVPRSQSPLAWGSMPAVEEAIGWACSRSI